MGGTIADIENLEGKCCLFFKSMEEVATNSYFEGIFSDYPWN